MSDVLMYGRKYRLLLGEANAPEGIVVIEGHHVVFSAMLSAHSESNALNLQIYNLSDDVIRKFDKEDSVVILEAGYEDHFGVIFSGNVTKVMTVKHGPDFITTVAAGDGSLIFREAKISYNGEKAVTLRTVLSNVVSQGFSGNGSLSMSGDVLDKTFAAGVSVVGGMKANLDAICDAHKLHWHILNNDACYIYPKDEASPRGKEVKAVVLSPSTGLIDSVEKIVKDVKHLKRDAKAPKQQGVSVKSLLNHEIFVGGFVVLKDTAVRGSGASAVGNLDGQYIVTAVKHTGQFEGDDWTTAVELQHIK